jgi:hypothetical protein
MSEARVARCVASAKLFVVHIHVSPRFLLGAVIRPALTRWTLLEVVAGFDRGFSLNRAQGCEAAA